MTVTMEKQAVRATISFGDLIIQTPDVVSFNVRRARGQMCATFTASVRVSSSHLLGGIKAVGAGIVIKAGFKDSGEKTIFTGKIFKATVNPIRTDASKVMLSLSGKDVLHIMEGQKINRRVKTYRDGEKPPERWGLVNSITKENTGMRASFPKKMTSRKPKVVKAKDLPGIVYTTKAYSGEVDRSEVEATGGIVAERLGGFVPEE